MYTREDLVINKHIENINHVSDSNVEDMISRQAAIDALNEYFVRIGKLKRRGLNEGEKAIRLDTVGAINSLPPAHPEIIRCKDCKFNPKYEWFGCPMSHLSEKQRPETAWCWKAERRTDG